MMQSLRLQHFRSYSDTTVEFETGVNIIVGANASGKTNLLEALQLVATGTSFRAKDSELLQYDEPWYRLDGVYDGMTRTVMYNTTTLPVKKQYVIDDKPLSILRSERMLPLVLFEPEHLLLLTGSPDLRRNFMDDLLSQLTPMFRHSRMHYRRALAQRNALLKQAQKGQSVDLFPWNVRLSDLGSFIAKERKQLIEACNEYISEIYSAIAGKPYQVDLMYKTPFPISNYSSALLKHLEEKTNQDILRGFTSYGPHREDMITLIDQHPADETASRGETRTLMLALKILEMRLLEDRHASKPMVLLDDVFSELDGVRRKSLTRFLADHQTFITTTDADIVLRHFMQACHIIPTSNE